VNDFQPIGPIAAGIVEKLSRCIDLRGQRFGQLVVCERLENTKAGRPRWSCRCDCGGTVAVVGINLKTGNTKSCGCTKCTRIAAARTRHGASHRGRVTTEYTTWNRIIGRCTNPSNPKFPIYGGRGIRVCDRWATGEDGLSGFECFLADMGRRPPDKSSIDRIDNNGNYEPGNCRWSDPLQQSRNRRPYTTRRKAEAAHVG
jgi:hypothetical protein